jgi:hypothetical protein
VFDIQIKDPVFIIGNPRTGSTLFHNLISVDPLTRSPMLWEMKHPMGDPNEVRKDTATKFVGAMNAFIPLFDAFHHLDPLDTEECKQVYKTNFFL